MIEVDELSKQFVVRRGRFRRERHVVEAVRGISFRVERGELLGYLGPNGAGKSTTIKMLTGILVPSSGRVSVAGLDPSRRRLAGRIAWAIAMDLPSLVVDAVEAVLRHAPDRRFPGDRLRFGHASDGERRRRDLVRVSGAIHRLASKDRGRRGFVSF